MIYVHIFPFLIRFLSQWIYVINITYMRRDNELDMSGVERRELQTWQWFWVYFYLLLLLTFVSIPFLQLFLHIIYLYFFPKLIILKTIFNSCLWKKWLKTVQSPYCYCVLKSLISDMRASHKKNKRPMIYLKHASVTFQPKLVVSLS